MNDIILSSHIIMHFFFNPRQLWNFWLFFYYSTIEYFKLLYRMPLLTILHYFFIGYYWLF